MAGEIIKLETEILHLRGRIKRGRTGAEREASGTNNEAEFETLLKALEELY